MELVLCYVAEYCRVEHQKISQAQASSLSVCLSNYLISISVLVVVSGPARLRFELVSKRGLCCDTEKSVSRMQDTL